MVVASGDDQIAIVCGVHLEGGDFPVARTLGLGNLAQPEVSGQGSRQQSDLAVQHGDIDLDRTATLAPLVKGPDQPEGEVQARAQVADRDAHARRRGIRLPGQAHDPAHSLHHHVVGSPLRVWPAIAEPQGRTVDQLRVAGVQGLPPVAELFHRPRPEVFDQDVGDADQPLEDFAVGGLFQIEGNALLVVVEGREIERLAVGEWPVGPGVVARYPVSRP
jgi:hypothetical protein